MEAEIQACEFQDSKSYQSPVQEEGIHRALNEADDDEVSQEESVRMNFGMFQVNEIGNESLDDTAIVKSNYNSVESTS